MKKKISLIINKGAMMALMIIRIFIMVGTTIGIFMFFKWTGLKGVLSFFIGMTLMAYLLLSKNLMVKFMINMFGAEQSINEIIGKENEKENKKIKRKKD